MYLAGIYAHPSEARTASRSCWQAMSLLFAIFALGALFEQPSNSNSSSPSNLLPSSSPNLSSTSTRSLPPINPIAYAHFRTARAALALAQPTVKTTATCVLTLVHLAQWLDYAQAYVDVPAGAGAVPGNSNIAGEASGWVWAYMGLAVRLGTSVRSSFISSAFLLPLPFC